MDTSGFFVVGLGASAGGIQAVRQFFQHVPADSGLAYVVILHLSPHHDSRLAEVLQVSAAIPVMQPKGRVRVEPNHVYVIPPNQSLSMSDGDLALSEMTRIEERRAPVDIFFRTLAESHRSRAVCVVLSGTGANGSMGLKRVKEEGGFCLVQDPEEAEYADMPRNSIATALVDHVLPVAEMPAKIIAYKAALESVRVPEDGTDHPTSDEEALGAILAEVRIRTGHDFSNYKRGTVLRRIARRMGIHELAHLPAYADFLRAHREEAQALLKDLLITVTNFFRDREAFERLEREVIPRLFTGKAEEDQIRVWIPGCATGEEAYSIAMLLAEHSASLPAHPAVQVVASDIDASAIAVAREGCYTLNDAADVSSERLHRFFSQEGNMYRARKELRETILFALHNVITDPPFSHLDLVSCRNLLIYLNRTAQQRIMQVIHFALNPGGFLFLGSSEAVEGSADLFVAFDRDAHLFQSRAVPTRIDLSFPHLSGTAGVNRPRLDGRPSPLRLRERPSFGDLHQRLLEQYAPPSVVVNEAYDIVHLSDRAGRYLRYSGGEPSHNLLRAVRPELVLELRTALCQAAEQRTNVESRELPVRIDDQTVAVTVVVRPVLSQDDTTQGFFLVLFKEDTAAADVITPISDAGAARRFDEELVRLRTQLHTTIERDETQAEELKASNEELQAMNEELRTTAEELETNKEELQSLNEELSTVNEELTIKVEEESQAKNDIWNLINSSEIGTIFLDAAFRINLFTPDARKIFSLIPTDMGRQLSDINCQLMGVDLRSVAHGVLERLERVEREVKTRDDRWYLMRALPYRTGDDRIGGVVLTFVDITVHKQSAETARGTQMNLEARVTERTSALAGANRALDLELTERRRADERIRALMRRMITVQEDERRRISRDLHDYLGQQIAGLSLKLETLNHSTLPDQPTRATLAEVQKMIAKLDRDLDFFTWELRPAALDDLGLVVTLQNFVQEWSKYFGVGAEFHSSGFDSMRLGYETETNLYRITQEALNNVYKHGQALRVGVILERRGNQAVLVIEDDGRGFNQSEMSQGGPDGRGIGLVGMRERAALLGGTLDIETAPGKGTTIFVQVPLTTVDESAAGARQP